MDDPRPLRLRPQTEEPARAHVSPPTLTSPPIPLAASEGVFEERERESQFRWARAILIFEGKKRRKKIRIAHALKLASFCGFFAFLLSFCIWRRPSWEVHVANFGFQVVTGILGSIASHQRVSTRQLEALARLIPGAEKSDLSWLIEGTEYAAPTLRLALLEKIHGFLADLTPEDAVLLPEGARKILRSWPNGLLRQEPERTRETLRALAVIDDPKLPQLLRGIARWRPRHLGDEETIRLAEGALDLPPRIFPAPPATREEAEKAIEEETALRKRWSQMEMSSAIITFLVFLVQFGVAFYLGRFTVLFLGLGPFSFTIAVALAKARIHAESLYREAVAEAGLKAHVDG